jgi:hypothetical protein
MNVLKTWVRALTLHPNLDTGIHPGRQMQVTFAMIKQIGLKIPRN